MIDKLKTLIASGDISQIITLMFDEEKGLPKLKKGFFHERTNWDFKGGISGFGKQNEIAWAEIARHVLAFHNAEGGILIFGIDDTTFNFKGVNVLCDSARFNNSIRRYTGDLFYVTYDRSFIQQDQLYLGIALIPAHGPRIERFAADAPLRDGKRLFSRGDISVREGDQSKTYRGVEAENYLSDLALPRTGRGYWIDDAYYRILAPEFRHFVYRDKPCRALLEGLYDPRAAVISLVGIGGVGKTALATWGVMEAYKTNSFEFIVSITAKDRELTPRSIVPLAPQLTSYEELIDAIIHVLKLERLMPKDPTFEEKADELKSVLDNSNGLLYVDNLETVDDQRIIEFLENLPQGVKAIVTSRIPRIRRYNYPVDVGSLEDYEVLEFIEKISSEMSFQYLSELSGAERLTYGNACNRIPLAMRWIAAKCANKREALQLAKNINTQSRTNEELLEFSFRRIFDQSNLEEKTILKVLAVYKQPLAADAISIAAKQKYQVTGDVLERLTEIGLATKTYDNEINSNLYSLPPIVSTFVYGEVRNEGGQEDEIRKRMQRWLDADEVKDPVRKAIIRNQRQGQHSSEETLLQLAQQATDIVEGELLYAEAVTRFPRSWEVQRNYAEFLRHYARETGRAIEHYRHAASFVPKKDKVNRSIIYRELGIMLKNSGDPNGLNDSTKALQEAVESNPRDPIAANVLASNFVRLGRFREAIKLLEPMKAIRDPRSRKYILRTLIEAYRHNEDIVKVAELKQQLDQLLQDYPD